MNFPFLISIVLYSFNKNVQRSENVLFACQIILGLCELSLLLSPKMIIVDTKLMDLIGKALRSTVIMLSCIHILL